MKRKGPLGCIALLLFMMWHPGLAQDMRSYLVLVTSRSQWLVERFSAGCKAASAELNIQCNTFSSNGSPAQAIYGIEASVAQGVSGIVLQVDNGSDYQVYLEAIERAKQAGIPTVVASTTLIEAAAPYGDVALSIVGVSAATFASSVTQAMATAGAMDATFCVLGLAQAPATLSLANILLTAGLERAGAKRAEACPEPLVVNDTFEVAISSAVRELLTAQEVRFVVLPFGAKWDYLTPLKQIVDQTRRNTAFVSAWVSPFELSRVAAYTLYTNERGEKVEQQREMPPTIQISTDAYCESCNCDTETECKESCSKCN